MAVKRRGKCRKVWQNLKRIESHVPASNLEREYVIGLVIIINCNHKYSHLQGMQFHIHS